MRPGPWRSLFVAAVAGALLLRVVLRLVYNDMEDPELWEFERIARNLVETGNFAFRNPDIPSAFMPPAYPLMLAGLYALFGKGVVSHLLISIPLWLCEFAIPFLVGWLGARLWGRTAGFLAFGAALFWPNLLLMSGRLLNLPIYTALLVGSFVTLFSQRLTLRARFGWTGLLMGLFWTMRFEAPLFFLPHLYYLAFHARESDAADPPPWRRRVALLALAGTLFALPITPWIARNAMIFGEPLLSTEGGYHLLRGHHDRATGAGRDPWPANRGTELPPLPEVEALPKDEPRDEIRRSEIMGERAMEWIRENPRRELELVARKLYYFLVTDFTHPYARRPVVWVPSLVALLAGLVFWVRTGLRDPAQQALWGVFAVQLGLVVIFLVLARYRMQVDFVPLLFACAWLARGPVGRLAERRVLLPAQGAA